MEGECVCSLYAVCPPDESHDELLSCLRALCGHTEVNFYEKREFFDYRGHTVLLVSSGNRCVLRRLSPPVAGRLQKPALVRPLLESNVSLNTRQFLECIGFNNTRTVVVEGIAFRLPQKDYSCPRAVVRVLNGGVVEAVAWTRRAEAGIAVDLLHDVAEKLVP